MMLFFYDNLHEHLNLNELIDRATEEIRHKQWFNIVYR